MSIATVDISAAQARLRLAVDAARAAGDETLRWFRQATLAVERKGDGSPVTAADRAAETVLRHAISAAFPEDSILGEEFGETVGSSPYRWVLDPIDGTKSFITGVPLYTTLVAVLEDGHPLLGVIYAPVTREIVYAIAGQPTLYSVGDGKAAPANVSCIERLSDATFLTSEAGSFNHAGLNGGRNVYEQLERACRLTRTWGDAYGYMLVATGRADVMVDPAMNLWDAAALQPVIEGAGGHFSDWQGRPTVYSGNSVATNPKLAGLVLSITRSC
ncbi:MAG: histidinol-phosphatase [Planctomycetota bacterium]|nr:MAG: histidinol-phosphatase [Planctomycetota bacterium]